VDQRNAPLAGAFTLNPLSPVLMRAVRDDG